MTTKIKGTVIDLTSLSGVTANLTSGSVSTTTDTTSNSTFYVPYTATSSGNAVLKTSRLTVNPSTGDFLSTGNVTAYSDERLKENWKELDSDFVDKLATVKSGTYDRNDVNLRQVGVSAQSLETVCKEAINKSDDGLLSVAYGNTALAACVELAKRVIALENTIKELTK